MINIWFIYYVSFILSHESLIECEGTLNVDNEFNINNCNDEIDGILCVGSYNILIDYNYWINGYQSYDINDNHTIFALNCPVKYVISM